MGFFDFIIRRQQKFIDPIDAVPQSAHRVGRDSATYLEMVKAQEAGDFERAGQHAQRLLDSKVDEFRPPAQLVLAISEYLVHNRFERAASLFEQALSSDVFDDTRAPHLVTLGKSYNHIGRFADARAAFAEASENLDQQGTHGYEGQETRAHIHAATGESFSEQGHFESARKHFDTSDEIATQAQLVIRLASNNMMRAESLRQAGRPGDSIKTADNAIELFTASIPGKDQVTARAIGNDIDVCHLVAARAHVALGEIDFVRARTTRISRRKDPGLEIIALCQLAVYEMDVAEGNQTRIEQTEAWWTGNTVPVSEGIRANLNLAVGSRQYRSSLPGGLELLHEAIAYYDRIAHATRAAEIRAEFNL